MPEEWESLGEWLQAVMTAQSGGPVDPRLKPLPPPERSTFTDEEMQRFDLLATELIRNHYHAHPQTKD